jgi:hypothetical protein
MQLTLSWRNWTLANHSSAILECGVSLVQPVEMQSCSFIAEVVHDVDLDGVTNICSDGWTGPLAIDANEGTSESVRGGVDPSHIPVVRPRNPFRVGGSCWLSASCRSCLDRGARTECGGTGQCRSGESS